MQFLFLCVDRIGFFWSHLNRVQLAVTPGTHPVHAGGGWHGPPERGCLHRASKTARGHAPAPYAAAAQ
jgi:hypothetical protein